MRITVVTPSFNQGQFLEQTILSVLNQTHKDVEYMILDAGSKDGSCEIIEKYEERLAYWQSKPDRGFADAINQGWKRATGEILCYLNSDDLLKHDALTRIVKLFEDNADSDFIYGDAEQIDAQGKLLGVLKGFPFDITNVFSTWQDPVRQPSSFFKRKIFESFGGLDDSFQTCADFEYFVRISDRVHFLYVPEIFSCMRIHSRAKSVAQEHVQAREMIRMFEKLRHTPLFLHSGVSEADAEKGLYRVAGEHFISAGKKWEALKTHLKYTAYAYSGLERWYRIARYVGRLLLKNS